MKTLSYIAILLSLVGIGSGIYCQIEYVPKLSSDLYDLWGPALYYSYSETALNLGYVALFVGGLGLILGVVAGIKKQIIGWIAAGIGLISVIFGLMQATHMFS